MKQGRRPSRDKTSVKVTHKEYKDYKDNREKINYGDSAPGYNEFRNNAEMKFKKKLHDNKDKDRDSRTVSLVDMIMILKGRKRVKAESGFTVTDEVKIRILQAGNKEKTEFDFNDFQKVLVLLQDSKSLEEEEDDEEEFGTGVL